LSSPLPKLADALACKSKDAAGLAYQLRRLHICALAGALSFQ